MKPLIIPPHGTPSNEGASPFARAWWLFFDGLRSYSAAALDLITYGTHAERLALAASVAAKKQTLTDGAVFIETDRGGIVYQWTGTIVLGLLTASSWKYLSGTYRRTQAQLASLAATLGTVDTGLLVEVTDYTHLMRWTGTGWEWAPGETGSGALVPFAVAPTGNGWHACDGAAGVKYLKADGTTGTVTLPDTAGSAAYLKADAAYSDTINVATVPTISTPTFTGTPDYTGSGQAALGGPSSTSTAGAGGAVTLGSSGHTHVDVGHIHSVTPAGAVSAPTATLPADPVANFAVLLYFRQ